MLFPTQIPTINSLTLVSQIVNPGLSACNNPLFAYFAFGKLPENPVITPSTSVQVVRPSAFNRYLQSVTVKATPVTPTP